MADILNDQFQSLADEIIERETIMEYGFLYAKDICFEERIRWICEHECPRCNSSWSCPPAVGTVEECRERASHYKYAYIFSTISEVTDEMDMEETLATREEHEVVTRRIDRLFRDRFGSDQVLTLSTESCAICAHCSWPSAPCRHPDKMFPCVESYGIVVSDVASAAGMTFDNGPGVVTWFSLLFFNA